MNVGNLFTNYEEAVAMILFGIGFSNLLLQKNLIFYGTNSLIKNKLIILVVKYVYRHLYIEVLNRLSYDYYLDQ